MSLTPFRSLVCIFTVLTCSTTTQVFAQSVDGDGALSFRLGETNVFPAVRVDYLQNSNVFYQQGNVISAGEMHVSPELVWIADRRLLSLRGEYNGKYGVSSEDQVNFADHSLGFDANAELSSRKRLEGNVSLIFGHEELGINLTRGMGANGDQVTFTDFEAAGVYRYGARRAKGNIAAGLELQSFGYNNRSDVTAGRGYMRIEPFAAFSLRLSGDTRLLSEIRFGSYRFDDSGQNRDDLSLLTGMQFDATGKSGGQVRFGILQSQQKFSGIDDQTVFVMRASLFWEPTSFSRFELEGERALDNRGSSLVSADQIVGVEDRVSILWNHKWSTRVSHTARLQSRNFTEECPDLDNNFLSSSLELNLKIRRWLSIGVSGAIDTRAVSGCPGTDNDDLNLDFQQNRAGAHIKATL